MGRIDEALSRHGKIGLDTSVFVYHFGEVEPFAKPAFAVLSSLESGRIAGLTSVLTVTEIQAKPLQAGVVSLARQYRAMVTRFPNLVTLDVDISVAQRAAALRAVHGLRTPDALHLACCLEGGATAFVTNDKRLRKVTELEVVVLGDFIKP